MKKLIAFIIIFGGLTFPKISFGQSTQYIGHYLEKSQIKHDTLIDKTTGIRFILNKSRVFIVAIDKNGKLLWKANPVADNKLEEYRTKKPVIVYFEFDLDKFRNKQVIAIGYNNTQFGYIDKTTGHFTFRGQD